MSKSAKSSGKALPIVPLKTFKNFVARMNATALPSHVDNSILTGMAGSTRTHLKSALRFLGLTDTKDKVESSLSELVKSWGTDGWKNVLATSVEQSYAEVVGSVDLTSGTTKQLQTAFRTYSGLDGAALSKAMRFYLAALKEAEIPHSPHFKAPPEPRRTKAPDKPPPAGNGGAVANGADGGVEDLSGGSDDAEATPQGMERFVLPIPGKRSGVVMLPADLDEADWTMLKTQLGAYVDRLLSRK